MAKNDAELIVSLKFREGVAEEAENVLWDNLFQVVGLFEEEAIVKTETESIIVDEKMGK